MIDLLRKEIYFEGVAHPILRWEVWWRTPSGLFQKLDAALLDAEQNELPIEMMRAVPVAVGEGVYEER